MRPTVSQCVWNKSIQQVNVVTHRQKHHSSHIEQGQKTTTAIIFGAALENSPGFSILLSLSVTWKMSNKVPFLLFCKVILTENIKSDKMLPRTRNYRNQLEPNMPEIG